MECSFCGKTDGAVKLIIRGPAACICNECVKICKEIVEHENKKEQTASMENQNPIDIRKEYTTRDGGNVRILCDDGPGDTPVVAIVGYGPTISSVVMYTRGGRAVHPDSRILDLIEVRKKFRREVWVNVYPEGMHNGDILAYGSKYVADRMSSVNERRIACIPVIIEGEEGQGL